MTASSAAVTVADAQEVARLAENSRFKAWEQGWTAGYRHCQDGDLPLADHPKNPYQFHAKAAAG